MSLCINLFVAGEVEYLHLFYNANNWLILCLLLLHVVHLFD